MLKHDALEVDKFVRSTSSNKLIDALEAVVARIKEKKMISPADEIVGLLKKCRDRTNELDKLDKLSIEQVDNGFELRGVFSDESDEVTKRVVEDASGSRYLDCYIRFLRLVVDYFNIGGSKHGKERIRVVRERDGMLIWDDAVYVLSEKETRKYIDTEDARRRGYDG